MRFLKGRPLSVGMVWVGLFILGGVLSSCGDDDGGGTDRFQCTEERAGWERCEGDKIQWCHIVEGMDPHFHWGLDCGTLGYQCVETEDHQAFCVDTSAECETGEALCEDNTAHNCLDGNLTVEPCGTNAACRVEGDWAYCVASGECGGHGYLSGGECVCDRFYGQDPEDATLCVEEVSFPEQACVIYEEDTVEQGAVTDTFEEVFSVEHHADQDVPYQVTLPENTVSYFHFPVFESGEYVLFVDTPGVVDGVTDRFGEEVELESGGANGMCEETLVEHYHFVATYDGDGENPVPYVVRFDAVTGVTVTGILRFHDEH